MPDLNSAFTSVFAALGAGYGLGIGFVLLVLLTKRGGR